ncbi:MAG: hypothetical protein NC313_09560 [Butyrivibrio sp.]|nr:hypothetical protein [Butyrivibrio sp.]
MLDKYEKDIEVLLAWYERAKEATIIAESLDTVNGSFIQTLHEQRYSFDHFIRSVVYDKDGSSEEKVRKAISAAISHLHRGYSDSVEWIYVSVLDEYTSFLKNFNTEQIAKGFPNYYSEIRPELDKIKNQIDKYKINKSIEKVSDAITEEEAVELAEASNQYLSENLIHKLRQYLEMLHERQGTLLEIANRDRKEEKRKTIKDNIILPIITGMVGAVLGALLVLVIT